MKGQVERVLFSVLVGASAVLLLAAVYLNTRDDSAPRIYNLTVTVREPSVRFIKGMEQAMLDFSIDLQVIYAEDADTHAQVDHYLLGWRLGEWMAAQSVTGCYVFLPQEALPSHWSRYEGLMDAFAAYGISVLAGVEAVLPSEPVAAVVLDESLLVPLCENAHPDSTLFGIGYVDEVRGYLESGRLSGLAVYNEYDAGYLSLQAAVHAAEGKAWADVPLEIYIVRADNMYREPYVHILFPIE